MATDFQTVVRSIRDLPPMPVVATKVLQLLGDPDVNYTHLAQAISSDPAVSARLIKVANSSFYSMKRQIKTLDHAIAIVGERTLRSLVLAASLEGMNKTYGLLEKMLWEDAMGCAVGSRVLARKFSTTDPEEAFLAGLFRHLGLIVMNFSDPNAYRSLVETAYSEGVSTSQLEGRFFPYAHTVVGAAVLDKWNFSRSLVLSVLHHEDLNIGEDGDDGEEDQDPIDFKAVMALTATVDLAGHACLKLGIGQREPDADLDVFACPGAKFLELSEEQVEEGVAEINEVFNENKGFFVG